jgi:hypothetical protein
LLKIQPIISQNITADYNNQNNSIYRAVHCNAQVARQKKEVAKRFTPTKIFAGRPAACGNAAASKARGFELFWSGIRSSRSSIEASGRRLLAFAKFSRTMRRNEKKASKQHAGTVYPEEASAFRISQKRKVSLKDTAGESGQGHCRNFFCYNSRDFNQYGFGNKMKMGSRVRLASRFQLCLFKK